MMSHRPNAPSAATRIHQGRVWIASIAILLALLYVQRASLAQPEITAYDNTSQYFYVRMNSSQIVGSSGPDARWDFSGYWSGYLWLSWISAEFDPFSPYQDFLRFEGKVWYSAIPGGPQMSPTFDIGFYYPHNIFRERHEAKANGYGLFATDQTLNREEYFHSTGDHPGWRLRYLYIDIIGSVVPNAGVGASEPGTLALIGLGLRMVGLVARRRKP